MQFRSAESSNDSDEIDDQPKSKKRKADRLDKLISSVNSIKSSIEDINLHTRDTKSKLPIGLKHALQGTSNVKSVTHNLCNHQLWWLNVAKVFWGVNHVLKVGIEVQMPWQKLAHFVALNVDSMKQ